MRHIFHSLLFVVCSFCAVGSLQAQQPCNDTLVRVFDSICEDMEYDFNGRTLTRSGFYYDTLPRVGSDCDSVVILHLSVLEYPYAKPGHRIHCQAPIGYSLAVYEGYEYYRWSSTPFDSSLVGQEHLPEVFVNPKEPTTYEIYIDYRLTPQCPASDRLELNPVEAVRAQMFVTPDHLSYDQLELTVEDFSTGTNDDHYGGWDGRNWYLNGVQQDNHQRRATFNIYPWMEGDSVRVKMVAYTPTCVDSVFKVVPFRRIALYFPNAFTPGQPPNHTFQPVVQGLLEYELHIYDRRGSLVFHTTDPNTPWDGTYNGRPCPPATYVYKCRYRDLETPAGFQSLSGTLTLLR